MFLLVTVFPFYWILRTALSNNYSLIAHPTSILPTGFTFGAFARVLGLSTPAEAIAQGGSGASIDLALYIRNSVIYATLLTVHRHLLLSHRRLRLRSTAMART